MIELFCIGNAMVDVFAQVPPGFCKRFGLDSPLQHISAEKAASILTALPSDKVTASGGGAANTAKIAARLGVSAAFIGASGSDRYADLFEEELKKAGVFLHIAKKKSQTGVFISLNCKKPKPDDAAFSTCIVAAPSAALELEAEDIDEAMFKNKDNAQENDNPPLPPAKAAAGGVCMVEGFLLDRERLMGRILELVKKHNLALAIDMGTAEIAAEQAKLIQQKHSFFWDSQFPLILFLNEAEAEAFANILNVDWEHFFIGASKEHSVLITVKLSERGAAVFSGGRVYHVPAEKVIVVESTGAGDAFAAGFLATWLRGEGPEQCGREGNSAAVLVLQAPGTAVQ